ncbi:MAG: AgmX/PglI C-terminal domain-containing protein [Myxococcota bacterium]
MRRPCWPTLAGLLLLPACEPRAKTAGPETPQAAAVAETTLCDPGRVQALSRSLSEAEPSARAQMVAERFSFACEAPDEVAGFLAAGPPSAQGGAITAADWAVLADICGAADAIVHELNAAKGPDRAALMFERCDLDRFGLTDAAGWLQGDPSSPIPFFAYQWLRDQAVAEPDAKALAGAMLLKDQARWRRSGVELVTVGPRLPRVPDGVAVYVTPSEILVGDGVVGKLEGGKVAAESLDGNRISPLLEVLREHAEVQRGAAEGKGSTWDGQLVIVADARLPQETLIKVMYTAGSASFQRYAFVAKRDALTFGAIPVSPPQLTAKGASAAPLNVFVASDGFRVAPSGSRRSAKVAHLPMDKAGGFDFANLAASAAEFKRARPTMRRALVGADDSVSVGDVVRTLAAVRGHGCGDDGTDCVLPEVTILASSGRFDPDQTAERFGLAFAEGEMPYGVPTAVGDDEEAFGVGGLGLVGTGKGGGGTGEGTIGLGNVGLIGKGGGGGAGSGYGRGSGAGFGGRGKRVPRVRMAKATIDGALDSDITRRIVRSHINELRYCYNQGLVRNPELKGRVSVKFTVGPTGKVSKSEVKKSTVEDPNVGNCVAKAVKRWKFPKPTDGKAADVLYPFVLSPG